MKHDSAHFIGIGGVGMSGLAKILLKRGIKVSGSDLSIGGYAQKLQQAGATVHIGHDSRYIKPDMTVVYTSDVNHDNPEIMTARELGCLLLHRSDLLAQLAAAKRCLAVTGSHGKTTTTSLLTHTFVQSGKDPSFAVGGTVVSLQTNAQDGNGGEFILEADESDGTFLKYRPHGAIITNVDREHLAHFGTIENLVEAVKTFITQVQNPELLFWCCEDQRLCEILPPGVSYGFDVSAQLRAKNVLQRGWNLVFDLEWKGVEYKSIELPLIGKHNVLNATAVFGLALSMGLSESTIRMAFKTFKGVGRRVEKVGEANSVLFLDDYAHHPTEIAATLQGIRQAIGPAKRLFAVFQPHRYSRLRHLQGLLKGAFDESTHVLVTDIYAANEAPIEGLTPEVLCQEIGKLAIHVPYADLIETLKRQLQADDVVVTLGAGSITRLGRDMIEAYAKDNSSPLTIGLICGGRSVEHEISFRSSRTVLPALKAAGYRVKLFAISKKGEWAIGQEALEAFGLERLAETRRKVAVSSDVLNEVQQCDVLFPLLHGTHGEDGEVQGFLEVLQKPYVGSDFRASVMSMDKSWSKALANQYGIPTLPSVSFWGYEWSQEKERIQQEIVERLTFPLFVKPVHLGSSIGISKITSIEELGQAVQKALEMDNRILVENGIEGKEIEFAILGNEQPEVMPPAEILLQGKIYGYGEKYGIGGIPAQMEFNGILSEEKRREGESLAKKIYQLAGCSCLARVDFFLDTESKFWFNEINPMPGLTPTSGYPQMCQQANLTMVEVVQKLINHALQRHHQNVRLVFSI